MKRLYDRGGQSLPIQFLTFCKWMREHPLLSIPVSCGIAAVSFGLHFGFHQQYHAAPFLTLYPAVVMASLWGNTFLGIGVAAVLGMAQWLFFIPAVHVLAVATFGFDVLLCAVLTDFVNRAFDTMLVMIEREKRHGHKHYVVAHEMRHRVQNLFAVVQGVIRMSFRGEGPVDRKVYRDTLLDRIQSMADANRAITRSSTARCRCWRAAFSLAQRMEQWRAANRVARVRWTESPAAQE